MAEPERHEPIIDAPNPDKLNDKGWLIRHLTDIWIRTGGFTSAIFSMKGLKASVNEINTLVGINTGDTVQQQLNEKANTSDLGNMAFQNSNAIQVTGGTAANLTITTSTITNSTINTSNISIIAGASTAGVLLGGTLKIDMTAVGNVGTGEDNLISYAMPAKVLGHNLESLEITAFGTVAANANNKRIKLKFGTTTLYDTTAVAANAGSWEITSKITRTASAVEKCITKIVSSNSLILDNSNYVLASENTDNNLNIFCTGEATTNNDIVQEGLIIRWFNA